MDLWSQAMNQNRTTMDATVKSCTHKFDKVRQRIVLISQIFVFIVNLVSLSFIEFINLSPSFLEMIFETRLEFICLLDQPILMPLSF